MKKILVTGGAGYIGSHTVVALIEQGFEPIIYDNLSNSNVEVLNRIKAITKIKPTFIHGELRDRDALNRVFNQYQFAAVVHFAGLKAVGESVAQPLRYYDNNVGGSLSLFEAMQSHRVFNIVFSSSATVYGEPKAMPIAETSPLSATNPYGRTKLIIEQILSDLSVSDERWRISLLRYFNPVAAHESGLIGEHPNGIPNNLLPYIAQVAVGKLAQLSIFGDDYPTIDGTGVRDYIHVVDLADAHLKALNLITSNDPKFTGCHAYNIGTGEGISVLEMVRAYERACGHSIDYQIKPRRPGDVASCFADTTKTAEQLNWRAKYGLDQMMQDSWRWQSNNPDGYK